MHTETTGVPAAQHGRGEVIRNENHVGPERSATARASTHWDRATPPAPGTASRGRWGGYHSSTRSLPPSGLYRTARSASDASAREAVPMCTCRSRGRIRITRPSTSTRAARPLQARLPVIGSSSRRRRRRRTRRPPRTPPRRTSQGRAQVKHERHRRRGLGGPGETSQATPAEPAGPAARRGRSALPPLGRWGSPPPRGRFAPGGGVQNHIGERLATPARAVCAAARAARRNVDGGRVAGGLSRRPPR